MPPYGNNNNYYNRFAPYQSQRVYYINIVEENKEENWYINNQIYYYSEENFNNARYKGEQQAYCLKILEEDNININFIIASSKV